MLQTVFKERRGASRQSNCVIKQCFLLSFEEALEVDEEFSHGGDDGAFVGLASCDETGDIGLDDGVVLGGGLRGHVEAFADFGPACMDGAFGGSFAAVAVKGSDSREGDDLVPSQMGHLAKVSKEGPAVIWPTPFTDWSLWAWAARHSSSPMSLRILASRATIFLFEELDRAPDEGEDALLAFLKAVFLPGQVAR